MDRIFWVKSPKTKLSEILGFGKHGQDCEACKKQGADKAKKDQKPKNKESEAMDKGEVANMLGTLKCAKDPEKKELLAYYKSLPRFDGQKSELLKKWKADKTCKWIGTYKESRSQEHSTTHEEMSGFATKFLV